MLSCTSIGYFSIIDMHAFFSTVVSCFLIIVRSPISGGWKQAGREDRMRCHVVFLINDQNQGLISRCRV